MEKVGEGNFFCTGGDKKDDIPSPVVFELQKNGFHRPKKNVENKERNSTLKQPHVYG